MNQRQMSQRQMSQRRMASRRTEQGQAVVGLVVVLLIVVAAVGLLQRTFVLAHRINAKASGIAQTGRGINSSTDAIIQLDRTNGLGKSILATAQPLQPKLAEVVRLAQSIDAKAVSINGSAQTINGTAHAINGTGSAINSTANGINNQASSILQVAKSIQSGVAQINRNVDATIALAQQIKGDTGNIVGEAGVAKKEGACIDESLLGASDGHCR